MGTILFMNKTGLHCRMSRTEFCFVNHLIMLVRFLELKSNSFEVMFTAESILQCGTLRYLEIVIAARTCCLSVKPGLASGGLTDME